MKHFIRPSFCAFGSLVALLIMRQPATADIVFETEPNDTFATANQTVGVDNLGFVGSLTLGDVDTFSVLIIPNSNGIATVAYQDYWSAGSPNPPYNKWLNIRFYFNAYGNWGQLGQAVNQGGGFVAFGPTTPNVYYFQIFSTSPDPNHGGPVTGSTVIGDYRITNIRGLNGTIVKGTGTAVPEPTGKTLCLGILWYIATLLLQHQALDFCGSGPNYSVQRAGHKMSVRPKRFNHGPPSDLCRWAAVRLLRLQAQRAESLRHRFVSAEVGTVNSSGRCAQPSLAPDRPLGIVCVLSLLLRPAGEAGRWVAFRRR